MKIFILDDAEDFCDILYGFLRKNLNKEIQIVRFTDSLDCYHQATKVKPDLIIIDNCMPKLMGIDFIKDLKENIYEPKTIMISAKRSEYDTSLVDSFFQKPINYDNVLSCVTKLLGINTGSKERILEHLDKNEICKSDDEQEFLADVLEIYSRNRDSFYKAAACELNRTTESIRKKLMRLKRKCGPKFQGLKTKEFLSELINEVFNLYDS